MAKRAFRFHFNRINMQRGSPNVWSVHVTGRCIQTPRIWCNVPIESRFTPDGRQPRAVFAGRGEVQETQEGVVIT